MFTLPKLQYEFAALEPHIDAQTMEIHYTKHHQGYTDKLNAALEDHPDLAGQDITDLLSDLSKLPEEVRTAVRNNGGGYYNHLLFWENLSPDGGGEPTGALKEAIDEKFGSYDEFVSEFSQAAGSRFGSGWAWLVLEEGNQLAVVSTPNQDTPLSDGKVSLLGLDVWEHAYYLHYQNRRPDYVSAFWNVVNWDVVSERYAAATE